MIDAISSSDQTCFVKVDKKNEFFVRVSHGRFHDIIPEEYSGTFPELLWGR
jgi:hypothetical protein